MKEEGNTQKKFNGPRGGNQNNRGNRGNQVNNRGNDQEGGKRKFIRREDQSQGQRRGRGGERRGGFRDKRGGKEEKTKEELDKEMIEELDRKLRAYWISQKGGEKGDPNAVDLAKEKLNSEMDDYWKQRQQQPKPSA